MRRSRFLAWLTASPLSLGLSACGGGGSDAAAATVPTITSFLPVNGTIAGGTTVTITGTHLTGATAVSFGGVAGTGLVVTSDTQISVVSPAHAVGAALVSATTPNGSASAASNYGYLNTGVVTTLAGSGTATFANGTGTAASFYGPFGLAVDSSGNVYVGDMYNNMIRKITPAGVVSTLAGQGPSNAGSADGTGTAASFNSPSGVAVDSSGNVYVADWNNSMIRQITPAGVVSTWAGSPTGFGSTDGTGTAATFEYPRQQRQCVCRRLEPLHHPQDRPGTCCQHLGGISGR